MSLCGYVDSDARFARSGARARRHTRTETHGMGLALAGAAVQGLNQAEQALTGVHVIDDVHKHIHACVVKHQDAAVAFIPEGPYVVPVC